jgi:pimeloyl-ACP methyl ester carboxylesterase
VVGHSLGAMVALALALDHPDHVGGLVLASGYYFPSMRADVVLSSPSAMPLLDGLLCHTVMPLIGEMTAPRMIADMFSPLPVPARFQRDFPVGLMLRPSQINASAKDATHMIPDAVAMSSRYEELSCPIAIVAGDEDKVVDLRSQAVRLHGALPHSSLDIVKGAGHMVHHADPGRILQAIERFARTDATAAKTADRQHQLPVSAAI